LQPEELTVDLEIDADFAALEDEEALRLIEEAAHEAAIQRLAEMRALVGRLAKKRDESIKAKRPIDKMAMDSLRLYRGDDRLGNDATKDQPIPSNGDQRSPTPHLLRARTDRWEARMCDMLSAQPWSLEPDVCGKEYENNPELQAMAQTACDGMEETIKSQWQKSRADRSIRKMCRDAARMGTGLISGPFATVERKRRYMPAQPAQDDWQQQGFVPPQPPPPGQSRMVLEETTVPEIREGDMLHFFPDMTQSAEQAEYAHYLHLMGPLEIRNLAPGFDQLQINALLKTEPELGEIQQSLAMRTQYLDQPDICKGRYAVWHYTGVLGKEDLDVLGLEIPPECECHDDELGSEAPPPMAMADIWYCQDFVLRATLAKVPDDFRIPYYVFAPFRLDGSMFGMSLPMLGEDSQRVIKAAWLMALHNQSVSSGPLIIERAGALKPRDGQYNYRGPKVQTLSDPNVEMAEALQVINIPNESEGALRIMDRATVLLDEELNSSQWAGSDMAESHETASGFAMELNAKSILQLMVAAAADDDVFEPAITRLIWWNNDFSDDESIKGDFAVRPTVQSERMVKDVQMQQMLAFLAMASQPQYEGMVNNRKALEAAAGNLDSAVTELLVPESEYKEAMANKPPDPAAIQAQIMQLQAQTEQLKAQRETVLAQTDQIKQQIELLKLQAEQNPQGDDGTKITELQIKAEANRLKEKQIEANLDIAQMREEGQRMIAAAKAEEQRQQAAEFAWQKEQDRKTQLMTEGMKMESSAQEMALKRQTGSGI
jgi:hypothetical protein